jgi:hypothetical protein
MTDDARDFLRGAMAGKYPGAKFDTVGDTVAGIIEGEPKVVETQYGRRLLVDLKQGDRGTTLWVKEGPMAQAVAKAVADAGVETVAEGGKLAVVFSDEKDTGKGNPLKLFEARYEPPAGGVKIDDIFGGLDQ